MIYWIAKIYKNNTTQEYYYVIIGNQNKVLFTSAKYQSLSSCENAIATLKNSLKSNNLLFKINNVIDSEKFYFVVFKANDNDEKQGTFIGNSPYYINKQQCNEALDSFKNIMCNSGQIIYPETRNDNQNTVRRPVVNTNDNNNISPNTKEDDEVIPIDPRIMDYMFSLDGVGFDNNGYALSENPTEAKQWEHPQSVFWSNDVLREQYLKIVLKLGDSYEK